MTSFRILVESKRKLFWTFAAGTFILDQLTKLFVVVAPASRVTVVPYLLWVVSQQRNQRGVFGQGPSHPAFYLVVGGLGLIVVAIFLLTSAPGKGLVHLALGMLAGGAAGNLLDRVAFGGVTDFIKLVGWPWAFNVADAAICAGFVLVLYDCFFVRGERKAVPGEGRTPEAP